MQDTVFYTWVEMAKLVPVPQSEKWVVRYEPRHPKGTFSRVSHGVVTRMRGGTETKTFGFAASDEVSFFQNLATAIKMAVQWAKTRPERLAEKPA